MKTFIKMSEYGLFLAIAVFIDILQLILGWTAFAIGVGLEFITPAGGGAAGAVAGTYVCFDSATGIATAIVTAAKCAAGGAIAGALISAFGIPLGTVLGFCLEMVVSLTLGSALILLLWFFGIYSRTATTIGWIVEMIPGIDIIPGWTFMVIVCILKKEGKHLLKTSAKLAKKIEPGTMLGTAAVGVQFLQQKKVGQYKQGGMDNRQQLKTNLKNVDGINANVAPRKPFVAANDNQPNHRYVQKAA